jgi:hypothetical protein
MELWSKGEALICAWYAHLSIPQPFLVKQEAGDREVPTSKSAGEKKTSG